MFEAQKIVKIGRNVVDSLFTKHWGKVLITSILLVSMYLIYYNYANKTSFSSNIEGLENDTNPATLMLFHVDWCPHCKTAKPEWDKLKEEYEGKTINGHVINFEEYNCTTDSSETDALMDKYKIEGYPTIKLLKDNQVIEYDAKPTKTTMSQFLTTVI